MNVDLGKFSGECACGKSHALLTKKIIIESGARERLNAILDELVPTGKGCIVCDENTLPYAQEVAEKLVSRVHDIKPLIVLDPQGLHADEKATAKVQAQLPGDAAWLLAAGSGTIHDTTRYAAHHNGIPFISYPTAASVDGFVSTVSAMTWYGFKKTLPGVAPLAVVADTDIFSKAPYRLTAAGIGDVLGKYISLTDWQIAALVTGEEICDNIISVTRQAVDNVRGNLKAIRAGDSAGFENLMYAQLLSGIAMQMWGNSRPASGAEHHLSHFWEMEVVNPYLDALHGEKVGIGLHVVLPLYRQIAGLDSIDACLRPYAGFPTGMIRERFGPLADAVLEENEPDLLSDVEPSKLSARFGEIQRLIHGLPDEDTLRQEMKEAGCPVGIEEIGLDSALLADSIALSPFVRRRMTFLRMSKLLELSLLPV